MIFFLRCCCTVVKVAPGGKRAREVDLAERYFCRDCSVLSGCVEFEYEICVPKFIFEKIIKKFLILYFSFSLFFRKSGEYAH